MAKWINCKNCGHEYLSSLNRCPECSTPTPSFKKVISVAVAALFCALVIVGIVLGFRDNKIKTAPDSSKPVLASSNDSSDISSSSSENEKDESSSSSKNDNSSSKKNETASSKKDISSAVSQKPSSSVISGIHNIVSSLPSSADNTSSDITQEPSEKTVIGTVLKNKFAYTTVPEYYLRYLYSIMEAMGEVGSFEDFAYKLSDEDINYGFTEIKKNADGSATLVMPLGEKRIKFRTEYIAAGVELLEETKKLEFVKDVYGNNE